MIFTGHIFNVPTLHHRPLRQRADPACASSESASTHRPLLSVPLCTVNQ